MGSWGVLLLNVKVVNILSFWVKLVQQAPLMLSNMVYNPIYNMLISWFYDNIWLIFAQKNSGRLWFFLYLE